MNGNGSADIKKLLNLALLLSFITIFYNIAEGLVSVFFGYNDDALTLFGFGVDSFVEVVSGIGIFHMVYRMRKTGAKERDKFEKGALLVTGVSFIVLAAGLAAGSVMNFINRSKPITTAAGTIISAISIVSMFILMRSKLNTGRKLASDAIIADAKCTMTCFYMSFILLGSSLIYHFFKIGFIDIIGSIGIAVFSFREGIEALEKSKKSEPGCSCED